MDSTVASWARTKSRLESARGLLANGDALALNEYQNYLSHNELGLAFEVLVEIGLGQTAQPGFWINLREAAREMALTTEDEVHAASVEIMERQLLRGQ